MSRTTDPTHRRRTRRGAALWLLAGAALAAGFWFRDAIVPLLTYARTLLVFTAPGVVLGLAVGWLSHAFHRADFTWHRGLVSAITGAVALPPVLAAAIMLTALTFPDGVIQLFVWGAWAAVVIGLVAAVVGWGARRLFQRHPLPVHRITRAVRRPRGARRAPGETGDPAH